MTFPCVWESGLEGCTFECAFLNPRRESLEQRSPKLIFFHTIASAGAGSVGLQLTA